MNPAKANRSFAMHRCRVASTSCARLWDSMRSPPCRPPTIDQTAGIVNLTTVLAHSSGEWIASDWPVCAIADMAAPQRMGAALTYARRYALFTLVGIAGEDDLDAPDLPTQSAQPSRIEKHTRKEHGRLNGRGRHHPAAPTTIRRHTTVGANSARLMLGPEASLELRDSLLAELNRLGRADDAAIWAQRRLPEKNELSAPDAQCIEESFTAKLASFVVSAADPSHAPERTEQPLTSHAPDPDGLGKRSRSNLIDKGVLALPEPRRIRDRDHVKYVAKQPCMICARLPSDAHHLRFTRRKPGHSAARLVMSSLSPLCRGHHREVHRTGDEAEWWNIAGIDPSATARALWLETHPPS